MLRGNTAFLKGSIFTIGLTVLLLFIILLPHLADEAATLNPEFAYLKMPVLIGLYMTGVPFYIALYEAFKLLRYIELGSAFSKLAVNSLNGIKIAAVSIMFLYFMGMVVLATQSALHPGIGLIGLIIIFASLIITFFAAVLQQLLRSALELKTENDLTV
ncbi:DUF2975 domain-containing protein [Cytobacillus sp. FJAT-54145]|uniref:DUF2975 domain-containing protein n=1 Tax=Cytobacillus spartinae TaxID=3299023 RepID=A0ABW6K6S0_9BACI